MNDNDKKLLEQAEQIIALADSAAYTNYIRPFLINLAQEGYPKPDEYKTFEELMIKYTRKTGETDAVKKIISYIESQHSVKETIGKKYSEDKKESAI
jgi:hypothetical protein